ncbi:hypothetical protein AAE250_20685 [Bacteroides sp. GD17]|jgi:DNA-binding NtrC family response regulator|uniref:hypothetical protein n=1 Tax=Bacteroides sp. GD17 TaxID=3139826 RepID=UPI00205BAB4D|nr:hypothetical protein [uncultured Bacteroides sp.]DAV89723.1 MAG TPA: Clr5 domain protein [Caudoviricetes sp.]
MRAVDKKLKRNKQALPDDRKKVDTSVNGDAERLVEEHRKTEKKLFPLRIDHRTTIYVTKDKLTSEYVEQYKKRMSIQDESCLKRPMKGLSKNNLYNLYITQGKTLQETADAIGVCSRTIAYHLQKYGINKKKNGKDN